MKDFNLREFRAEQNLLSDYIPWAALVGPGTILNKDGSFQKTYLYRGRDLDSATPEEMMVCVAQLNNILRRISGNWALYIEARRERSEGYPQRQFPDVLSAMIDAERHQYFSSGYHYESRYYLTLQYLPPADKYDKLEKIFMEKESSAANRELERVRNHKKTFLVEAQRVYNLLCEVMTECRELDDDETLTYLHSCISIKKHPIKTPQIPVMLDAYLYDTVFYGGKKPRLRIAQRTEHLGIISVFGFPPMTFPGILDELNRLGYEYRWVTRYLPLDKVDAEKSISSLRRQWFAKRKSMATILKEAFTKTESAIVEEGALDKYSDAQAALAELDGDIVNFGYFKTTIVLKNENAKILEDEVAEVEKAINSKGFASKQEDLNAVSAWMGTIPGLTRADVRAPVVSSLNLGHMLPISAVWSGDAWNKHLDAPPLMRVQTNGSTPFFLNLHVGDVGNCMIVGPVGSGKSVLLNTIIAQYRGYDGSQIYIFDKGASSRVLTAGVGGNFFDLGDEGEGISVQPLAHIDQESERIWASEWLQMIFTQENVDLSPEDKKDIWNALTSMANTAPIDQRTMSGFYLTIQNIKLKDALEPFLQPIPGVSQGGPYGRIFDADKDTISYGRWQAFEMGELMHKKSAVLPMLEYLFHVIEKRCNGAPTIIDLDECWTFLDNPVFAEKIREWFKTMRKNNVAIIFATQNLQDIAESKIAPAILENCFTRIFLPNPNAMNPNEHEIYRTFNINEKERNIIAKAIPKRQYYYKSTKGSRLFDLALSDLPIRGFALSYLGSSSKEDQAECKRILATYPREEFNERWMRYKGQNDALELYNEFQNENVTE